MKRLLLSIILFGVLSLGLHAQMLTRFAVVDLPRVYMAFFQDSREVRDFEERSARVQAEIDRMTAEINNMRVNLVNAQAQGNAMEVMRLETTINQRTEFLREYHRVQTSALEQTRANLSRSGSFMDQIYDEIRFIAESEGYSMVINLTANSGILWYSPTVDITDRLIQSLRTRR
ncbi:MAG: OmpH family outer membrane protein [Treponema sp.]|nr:OmpH family outer membrane protein [Treponema sp.]